jgi:PAS domain-containing protein
LNPQLSERALILAPHGRDGAIASDILQGAGIVSTECRSLSSLLREMESGAGLAVITSEAIATADLRPLREWIDRQPDWSDFPFVLLVRSGGRLERNPEAARQLQLLNNVSFLERPFHPTSLVSLAQAALRGRRRQYEARARLEELSELTGRLKQQVKQRTAALQVGEKALRQSEEQFRLLVRSVTDYAIYRLDLDGRVSSWNAGAERIKGYQPEEIIGEHFSRFYIDEDRKAGHPATPIQIARP